MVRAIRAPSSPAITAVGVAASMITAGTVVTRLAVRQHQVVAVAAMAAVEGPVPDHQPLAQPQVPVHPWKEFRGQQRWKVGSYAIRIARITKVFPGTEDERRRCNCRRRFFVD